MKEREKVYRTQKAQTIHNNLIEYFFRGAQKNLNIIKNMLLIKDDRSHIRELSTNGYSHITDMFHIGYDINKDNLLRFEQLASTLFNLFMKHTSPEERAFLLTKGSKLAYTPLHAVLRTGYIPIIELYWNAVKEVYNKRFLIDGLQEKNLDKKKLDFLYKRRGQIFYLLTKKTESGFTPLQCALESAPSFFPELLSFTSYIFLKVEKKPRDYAQFLIQSNRDGFTLLHQALKSGSLKNVKLYLGEIEECLNKKLIKATTWFHRLCKSTTDGFTPAHDAMRSPNQELGIYFLDYIEDLRAHYKDEFPLESIYSAETNEGDTLLSFALRTGKGLTATAKHFLHYCRVYVDNEQLTKDCVSNQLFHIMYDGQSTLIFVLSHSDLDLYNDYIGTIDVCTTQRSKISYVHHLRHRSVHNYTSLLEAAKSKHPLVLIKYFQELIRIKLNNSEIVGLLMQCTNSGFTPLLSALKEGLVENVRNLMISMNLYLTDDQFESACKARTRVGYNALHQVCFARSYALLEVFVSSVKTKLILRADDVLKDLASEENVYGCIPSCKGITRDAKLINEKLKELRLDQNKPVPERKRNRDDSLSNIRVKHAKTKVK